MSVLGAIHADLVARSPAGYACTWVNGILTLTGPKHHTYQEIQELKAELAAYQRGKVESLLDSQRFHALHYLTHGQIPPIYVRIQGEHLLVGEHILELANPRSMDQMDQILREAGIPLAIPIKSENG